MGNVKTGFSPFEVLGDFGRALRGGVNVAQELNAASLTEYLRNTKVEPVCLIEQSLLYSPVINDVVSSHLNSFCSWYLQAASRKLGVVIDGARVQEVLESLSTNRNVWETVGLESAFQYGLPNYADEAGLESANAMSKRQRETGAIYLDIPGLESADKDDKKSSRGGDMSVASKESIDMVSNANSLSSGKTIAIKVQNGKGTMVVPIQVRFQTKSVSTKLIEDIFKANDANLDLKVRFRMFGMGEITFRELLSSSDIIESQERIRVHDKNGDVTNVFNQQVHNAVFAAATGIIPINRASAVTIISANTAKRIEGTIGGRFDNFKARQKFFKNTAATVLSIIDEEAEMVTTYYRGIKDDCINPYSFFKREGGKSGTDILPIMKALLAGNAPRY